MGTRKADSKGGEEANKGVGANTGTGGRNLSPTGPGRPSKGRGGGPKTASGKSKSSLNAVRHGILSQSPVVGDEKLEEWIDHLNGMRDSWQPVGHFEELMTVEAAMNRWKRARVERAMCGAIQSQIDLALEPTRESQEDDWDALPADEQYWFGIDAGAVLHLLNSVESGSSQLLETMETDDGVQALVEKPIPLGQALAACPPPPSMSKSLTEDVVRQWLQGVAGVAGVPLDAVVEEVREELGTIIQLQLQRLDDDRRRLAAALSTAYLPSERDAEREMRYAAHLDRGFDRIVKNFEKFQRARQGTLPPPVRLEVDAS